MPPEPPPVPIFAEDVPGGAQITFDRPLATGLFDTANWSTRVANQRWPTDQVRVEVLTPTRVDVIFGAPPLFSPGPDVVTYNPPPFDIVSAPWGVPAAGFADYPLA